MDDKNKNLILATGLSFLVILVWLVLFPPPTPEIDPNAPATVQSQDGATGTDIALLPPAAGDGSAAPADATAATTVPAAPRLPIDTPELEGSISLIGGRIDDL